MKEQVLNPGDRAALQALVPLAGARGVGTIFALFFGGRRKAGLAVFELFAIVAVLTAAGSTAYFSVALLHQNTAISSHELTQTATPLLVAAILLVFVSVFARLPGSPMRALMILPLAVTGVVVAAVLAPVLPGRLAPKKPACWRWRFWPSAPCSVSVPGERIASTSAGIGGRNVSAWPVSTPPATCLRKSRFASPCPAARTRGARSPSLAGHGKDVPIWTCRWAGIFGRWRIASGVRRQSARPARRLAR